MKRTLLAALALPAAASAETLCSCSPTSYSFALNFDGNCNDVTGFDDDGLEGPPYCLFTMGGDPDDIDSDSIGFGPSRKLRRLSKGSAEKQRWDRALSELDFSAHVAHAKKAFEAKAAANRYAGRRLFNRQDIDTTPVTVTSITFLESDTTPQLNIINQDSTYFDTSLSDGDTVVFDSISAQLDAEAPLDEQLALLPGGVMMVLFGTNAAGEVIRNTVAWGYDTSYCTGELLDTGDAIGWITFEDYVPPIVDFCKAPTESPVAAPVPEPAPEPEPVWSAPPKSKASKSPDTKAQKATSAKAEKMSMDTSAKATKVFKDGKSAKGADAKSSKQSSDHNEKGTADAKAKKESSASSKAEKSSDDDMDTKAGKESTSSGSSTKGSSDGMAKTGKMSMPSTAAKSDKPETHGAAPSSKAKKPSGGDGWSGSDGEAKSAKMSMPDAKSSKGDGEPKAPVDAKAEKEGSSSKSGAKSSKMSMPDAKSGKGHGDGVSGKSAKAKSAKGTADAKAQKESSAKSVKPDPINVGEGYRVVGLP